MRYAIGYALLLLASLVTGIKYGVARGKVAERKASQEKRSQAAFAAAETRRKQRLMREYLRIDRSTHV